MWQNTKLLILFSIGVILLGLSFLWFGFKPSVEQVALPTQRTQASPGVATSSATWGVEGERVLVTEVVDGDTMKVSLQGQEKTVRLIGIDTPETVDPRRPVGCFGKEASREAKKLLEGKMVILQKDVSETDKYNRLLRLVFLPLEDGRILFVNDYLIRAGFAKIYTYPPDVKFNDQFMQAEKEAREMSKGLWDKCH